MSKFYFTLLNRHSWLVRKVERRRYEGDNSWSKHVSLDINFTQIRDYYRSIILGYQGNFRETERLLSQAERKRQDEFMSDLSIPVGCLDKRLLLSDYDLYDGEGNALSLSMGDACSYMSVLALCGAVEDEAEEAGADEGLAERERSNPLCENDMLKQFLQRDWIGNGSLPSMPHAYEQGCA